MYPQSCIENLGQNSLQHASDFANYQAILPPIPPALNPDGLAILGTNLTDDYTQTLRMGEDGLA